MIGKHVVVSGAGTGIGRAIALRLAREGASVTLLARGKARLEETAASIDGAASCRDVRHPATPTRAMERAAEALGPIHALAAASGVGGPNGEGAEDGDRFDDIVQTNLNGSEPCSATLHRARTRVTSW
jgi:NAD(P)-dependent dehydrogenase (short-subunit alcohol dehydrogenase family)